MCFFGALGSENQTSQESQGRRCPEMLKRFWDWAYIRRNRGKKLSQAAVDGAGFVGFHASGTLLQVCLGLKV